MVYKTKLVYKEDGKCYDVETGEKLELTHNVPVLNGFHYFLVGKPQGNLFWWKRVIDVEAMNITPELKQLIGKE